MHWTAYLLVPISIIVVWIAISLVVRRTGGYAPLWQVRCTKCGTIRDAAQAGLVRVKAASAGKRTLGWCSACRRFRVLAVEKVSNPVGAPSQPIHA